MLRTAIRDSRKLQITYHDEQDRETIRIIRPIAMAYYVSVSLLAAWCELRADYRHFRVDRIAHAHVLDDEFRAARARLMREWLATNRHHGFLSGGLQI